MELKGNNGFEQEIRHNKLRILQNTGLLFSMRDQAERLFDDMKIHLYITSDQSRKLADCEEESIQKKLIEEADHIDDKADVVIFRDEIDFRKKIESILKNEKDMAIYERSASVFELFYRLYNGFADADDKEQLREYLISELKRTEKEHKFLTNEHRVIRNGWIDRHYARIFTDPILDDFIPTKDGIENVALAVKESKESQTIKLANLMLFENCPAIVNYDLASMVLCEDIGWMRDEKGFSFVSSPIIPINEQCSAISTGLVCSVLEYNSNKSLVKSAKLWQ